ncbi:hypothetical protein LguiA_019799 [Lonicera macranthoides]
MGENWLEVKVMYCKDLKLFNFFQKLSVYALVSLLTDDDDNDKGGGGRGGRRSDKEGDENYEKAKVKLKLKKQQQRTPTDTEGEANPEWNHEIRFDLGSSFNSLDDFDDDRLFLHFDLRSEATGLLAIGGDRSIGEVWVPLKDLIQPHNLNGIARFVNYEVRTLDGKSNGVINFSFKLSFKQNSPPTNLRPINIHGYPIHHHHANIDQDQNPTSSPVNLYPPSPSLYSPSSELYYDAVTSPMTPYSPQQAFHQYQYPHPHPFSPLRPPQPVPYPHEFSQPAPLPPQQPMPYAYPPPHEHQAPPPNWAQYPHPPNPLYCAPSSAGGGYDYGLVPGSPGTPIGSQTTWPNHHFQPPGDHFPPPWNSR